MLQRLLGILITMTVLPMTVKPQRLSYQPGPANIDTSRFTHIYFLRDSVDDFPGHWVAVVMSDKKWICVKAKPHRVYKVNTSLTGSIRFRTVVFNKKSDIELNLEPGKTYYVALSPLRKTKHSSVHVMRILDESEGKERVRAYNGAIQENFCVLPFGQDIIDFRDHAPGDTVRWYAEEKHLYVFKSLPSWETIYKSPNFLMMMFKNPLISETYSEYSGISNHYLNECESQESFDEYCRNRFIQSIFIAGQDSLLDFEIKGVFKPSGVRFANMINEENKSVNTALPDEKRLITRSSNVLFFWTDQSGQGKTARLYISEEGLPWELHTMEELENRIRWVWGSFSLETIE